MVLPFAPAAGREFGYGIGRRQYGADQRSAEDGQQPDRGKTSHGIPVYPLGQGVAIRDFTSYVSARPRAAAAES